MRASKSNAVIFALNPAVSSSLPFLTQTQWRTRARTTSATGCCLLEIPRSAIAGIGMSSSAGSGLTSSSRLTSSPTSPSKLLTILAIVVGVFIALAVYLALRRIHGRRRALERVAVWPVLC
ncbi:hypothetical protein C8Q74DRAFT_662 [Fomes fomentarius]|nr:hypothetical protein C8Q74DRAFT_662 [Fomes fomentarius]